MDWLDEAPKRGDIIRTKVNFYHHYGIFVDEREVIQFGLPDGPARPAEQQRVLVTDIYTFLGGGDLETGRPIGEERGRMRTPRQIVETARSRIGEGGYDILHNNCEHFVYSCAFGESHSSFLEDVRARIRQKLGKA